MIIDQKSWHYQVYKFSYWGDSPSHQTNLCQYIRRLLLVAPLVGFGTFALFATVVILTIIGLLFMPIFGYLPTQWKKPWRIWDGDTYKYQGIKLGTSYNAVQLYPWHFIVLGLFIGVQWLIYHFFGVHPLVIQVVIVGSFLALVASIVAVVIYSESSFGKVINQYLAAKKQKVCPIVEFQNSSKE